MRMSIVFVGIAGMFTVLLPWVLSYWILWTKSDLIFSDDSILNVWDIFIPGILLLTFAIFTTRKYLEWIRGR